MHDWLTIELVLATLLVTSFASVGLLALWAATSPRHWFVRAAVVLAVVAPLLLIPAYEPFVVFIIQSAVVAWGAITYRWMGRRQQDVANPSGKSRLRFSLSTLLLLMVLAAIAIPVVIKLPSLNFLAWRSVVVVGVLCGLTTLVAGWMVTSDRMHFVWPAGLVICLGVGAILSSADWFAYSIIKQSGWPPTGSVPSADFPSDYREWPILVWLYTVPTTALLLTILLLLWSAPLAAPLHRVGRGTTSLLIVLLATFPLIIFWQLLHPLPVPRPSLPDPNGYDDLVAAGELINRVSPILNTAIDPTSTNELAAEVAKFAHVFERIQLGLSRPVQVPVWPTDANLSWESMSLEMSRHSLQSLRAVGRALSRKAELAEQEGRFRDAASASIENVRLGQASTRGGLLIHYLVGIACEGIGHASLYPAITHLDIQTCREMTSALEQVEQSRESLDDILHRDRIWDENAYGWTNHLSVILQDVVGSYGDSNWVMARRAVLPRTQAIAGLLMTELALRAYALEHGALPQSLEALVPKYLANVPIDPYDPDGGPLRYVRTAEGYVAYSVGYDGDDDGGRPPAKDEYGNTDWFGDGDLRLDVLFAPEDEVVDVAAVADAAEADATTHDSE